MWKSSSSDPQPGLIQLHHKGCTSDLSLTGTSTALVTLVLFVVWSCFTSYLAGRSPSLPRYYTERMQLHTIGLRQIGRGVCACTAGDAPE
jgi:uncharacterized membrane-anchored protein